MGLQKNIRPVSAFCLTLLFWSCASYNQQSSDFYSHLAQGDYEKASKKLESNRLLKKSRNRLLYLLEKGRVEHLLQHYESSNKYLNEADLLMEDARRTARDFLASNLINPMMQSYQGEDFEKYMVHYYKALNYLQQNNTEEALVEARRISLRTHAQDDALNGYRYTEDAFSFMLQGMIYERANDFNNAFIAYRNASDLYLKNGLSYYGTRIPEQLKKDLLRMANRNGFKDELERYEALLQMKFENVPEPEAELILFWENGLAPVKKEEQLYFSLSNHNGGYLFTDSRGVHKVPFQGASGYTSAQMDLLGTRSFRVALPRYEQQPTRYQSASLQLGCGALRFEPAQNIGALAETTLKERWLKELAQILTRQAIKKLAEEAAKPKEEKKEDKKDDKKKSWLDRAGHRHQSIQYPNRKSRYPQLAKSPRCHPVSPHSTRKRSQ